MIESYLRIKDQVKMAVIKANEEIALTPTTDKKEANNFRYFTANRDCNQ